MTKVILTPNAQQLQSIMKGMSQVESIQIVATGSLSESMKKQVDDIVPESLRLPAGVASSGVNEPTPQSLPNNKPIGHTHLLP